MRATALLFAAVLGALTAVVPARPAEPVRLMSFNIRYGTAGDGANHWHHRREKVAAFLRDERPDVLGVQEALRFQLDQLREALPGHRELGRGREDGATRGEYAALLVSTARFEVVEWATVWFSDTPDRPGSTSWGNTIPRICTWATLRDRATGRPLHVLNAHLDHLSAPSRLKSAERMAAWVRARPAGEAVAVLGDLNAEPDSEPLRLLAGDLAEGGAGLLDSGEAEGGGTFHAWTGSREGPRIDYILLSPGWTGLRLRVRRDPGPPFLSDHHPVLLEAHPPRSEPRL